MRQPETVFKEWLRTKLEEIPFSWWVKIKLPSVLGIPDILGVIHGRFIAIELKRSVKEKPSTMQLYILSRIADCGGIALVAYPENKEVILDKLKRLASMSPR